MPSASSLRTSPVDGVEDIHAVDLHLQPVGLAVGAGGGFDVDVGFAEDDEEVGLVGFLEVVGHVQVRVHAGLEDWDAAELVELGGVGLVVEGAGDQGVETRFGGFAHGTHKVGSGDGAELWADEDAGPLLFGGFAVAAFRVATFGADEAARPRV